MWRVYRQTEDERLEKFNWALRTGELEIINWWQRIIKNSAVSHLSWYTNLQTKI